MKISERYQPFDNPWFGYFPIKNDFSGERLNFLFDHYSKFEPHYTLGSFLHSTEFPVTQVSIRDPIAIEKAKYIVSKLNKNERYKVVNIGYQESTPLFHSFVVELFQGETIWLLFRVNRLKDYTPCCMVYRKCSGDDSSYDGNIFLYDEIHMNSLIKKVKTFLKLGEVNWDTNIRIKTADLDGKNLCI